MQKGERFEGQIYFTAATNAYICPSVILSSPLLVAALNAQTTQCLISLLIMLQIRL